MQNFRTDLAEEAVGLHQSAQEDGILQTEYYAGNHIRIVRVDITSQQASQKVGKPCGSYTTVFLPPFGDQSLQNQEDVSVIAGELSSLLPEGLILVVGLGNRDITPDAFGPRRPVRSSPPATSPERSKGAQGWRLSVPPLSSPPACWARPGWKRWS